MGPVIWYGCSLAGWDEMSGRADVDVVRGCATGLCRAMFIALLRFAMLWCVGGGR